MVLLFVPLEKQTVNGVFGIELYHTGEPHYNAEFDCRMNRLHLPALPGNRILPVIVGFWIYNCAYLIDTFVAVGVGRQMPAGGKQVETVGKLAGGDVGFDCDFALKFPSGIFVPSNPDVLIPDWF
jgi:hypothetical protein